MSAAGEVEVLVAVTRTGAIVDNLPFTDHSWKDSVLWSESCPLSVTVPFTGRNRASRAQRDTLKGMARNAWTYSIVIVRAGRAVAAGPAIALDWSASSITLGSPGLAAIFDRRMVIADPYYATPNDARANLRLALRPRDLVIELIDRGSSGFRRDLPIDLPSLSGKQGAAVTYVAADLGTVQERVKDVTDRDLDGPDVRLRPSLAEDYRQVRWQLLVGNPALGSPTSVATLDYPGAIATLSGTGDASEAVTTGYVPGNSTSAGGISVRTIGVAVVDPGDPRPALERVDRTSVSETRREQLNAKAGSYVRQYSTPTEVWQVSLHPDVPPLYGEEWEVGDVVTLAVDGHPWIDDGEYLRRVLSVDGKPSSLTMVSVAVEAEVTDVRISDAGGGELPDDITQPYLPTPAQPGGGTGVGGGSTDDPAPDIGVPNDLIPMARWSLTLPIADPSGEDTSGPWDVYPAGAPDRGSRTPDLLTFSHPQYFRVGRDSNGSYVEYVAPAKGVTTSPDSGAARSELRGLSATKAKASWGFGDGIKHELIVTLTCDPTSIDGRKETIVAQVHDAGDTPPIYLACNFNDGATAGKLTVFKNGPSVGDLLTGLTTSTMFTLLIRSTGTGRVQVAAALGGKEALPATPQLDWPASDFTSQTSGCYEKAGAYNKQGIATATTGQSVVRHYRCDIT